MTDDTYTGGPLERWEDDEIVYARCVNTDRVDEWRADIGASVTARTAAGNLISGLLIGPAVVETEGGYRFDVSAETVAPDVVEVRHIEPEQPEGTIPSILQAKRGEDTTYQYRRGGVGQLGDKSPLLRPSDRLPIDEWLRLAESQVEKEMHLLMLGAEIGKLDTEKLMSDMERYLP